MSHDLNGRVGPPRCEECNAPLTSDERRLGSTDARFLCLDCEVVLDSFTQPVVGQFEKLTH
ncbi:MAG TPA: hypothetical protein VIB39_09985 [Candidatus Angelobacter sp.]|jgi:hypothetical protein